MPRIVFGFIPAAVLGAAAWYKLLREERVRYDSDVEYFKYGSVGVEAANGLPYRVWRVLPEVFPDLVGGAGGYADDLNSKRTTFGTKPSLRKASCAL